MPSTHIDHVIRRLEYVIQWSIKNNSRMGYFASLYERVTIEVDAMIDKGYFNNNDLIMQFDVVFAEHYLLAFESYLRGEDTSEVWKLAFEKTKDPRITVLQHLLLGMNAHINLDLAVTVSNMCTPDTLDQIKPDFYLINEVLAKLVDEVQDQIGEIYKSMKLIDTLLGRLDEYLVNRTMARFRDKAWKLAVELTHLSGNERVIKIHETDGRIAKIANRTIGRPWGINIQPFGRYFLKKHDEAKIGTIIEKLHQGTKYNKWENWSV